MSRTTPQVVAGELRAGDAAECITLDSPAWFAWLADECHHSFHFTHPGGNFTARKERKQRGQWYWVAYRQVHNTLYKTYLGKSELLTAAHLGAAAHTLAQRAGVAPVPRAGAAADP
jgi:LuxR family maltose regulon positive regulatory protein